MDSTFAGKAFLAHIAQPFGWTLEQLKRTSEAPGFTVFPKRWVVERTMPDLVMTAACAKTMNF